MAMSRRRYQQSFSREGARSSSHDDPEVIEGTWHGTRTVVLEFDSVDAARNWYRSSQYQTVVGERHACTESNTVIVRSFQMPGAEES